jgi:peptidoglycan/LPS O-acetylase OafA/YrhL
MQERRRMSSDLPARATIASLQAGRAIAALMVVFHHAGQKVAGLVAPLPSTAKSILYMGQLGVDFFFVLSGFIIAWTMHATRPTLPATRTFLGKRGLRIFIPYWPVGVGLGLFYMLMPAIAEAERDWSWFPTLTLLPYAHPPALSVAWSLQHELVFYGLFAVLFLARRIWLGLALWAVLIILASFDGMAFQRPWRFLLHPINLEFLFGVAAAHAFIHGIRVPALVTAAGILLPLAAFAALGADIRFSFLFGLAIAFGLLPVVRLEARGAFRVGAGLVLLGNASYALYLVHNPLLSVLARLLAPLGVTSWSLAVLLLVPAVTILALAYHLLWERPAMAWATRRPPVPVRTGR